MSRALVGGFNAFQGADESVVERIRATEGYAARVVEHGAGKTNGMHCCSHLVAAAISAVTLPDEYMTQYGSSRIGHFVSSARFH